MRFLEDHELPQWEQDRRKGVRDAIERYRAEVEKAWKYVEPQLMGYIKRGDYEGERLLRSDTYRRTEVLRREIGYLLDMLPPHLLLRADEILEHVPRR